MPVSKSSSINSKTKASSAKVPWAALATFVHEIDVELHELSRQASTTAGEARVKAHLALMDLEQRWETAQTKLIRQGMRLRAFEREAIAEAGMVRVKAHLAKADALDAAGSLRDKLRQVERRLHAWKVKSESETSEALLRLGAKCRELSDWLEDRPKTKSGAGDS